MPAKAASYTIPPSTNVRPCVGDIFFSSFCSGVDVPFGTVCLVSLAAAARVQVCVSTGRAGSRCASKPPQSVEVGTGCSLPSLPPEFSWPPSPEPSAPHLRLLALRDVPTCKGVTLLSPQLSELQPAVRAPVLQLLLHQLDGWCIAQGCMLELPWGGSGTEVLRATVATTSPSAGLQRVRWGTTLLQCALQGSGNKGDHPGGATGASSSPSTIASASPSSPWKTSPAKEYVASSPKAASPKPVTPAAKAASPKPVTPAAPLRIGGGTQTLGPATGVESPAPPSPPCPLPGLDAAWEELWQCLVWPTALPQHFAALGSSGQCGGGLQPPRGILLCGPSGIGKTALVGALAREAAAALKALGKGFSFVSSGGHGGIQGERGGPTAAAPLRLNSSTPGEAEKALRSMFLDASAASGGSCTTLVFLDDLDALCPVRDASSGGLSSRLTAQLLTLMDGAAVGGKSGALLLVVAATSRPAAVDPALRRPGRFERELSLHPPTAASRQRILETVLTTGPTSTASTLSGLHPSVVPSLPRLAKEAVGFVGADLAALVQLALRSAQASQGGGSVASPPPPAAAAAAAAAAPVTSSHLFSALRGVGSSVIRGSEFSATVVAAPLGEAEDDAGAAPPWGDIGGCCALLARLQARVVAPFAGGGLAGGLRLPPPRGVLFYGPPGNSKTMLAKALARALGATFFVLSGVDILSCYVGEAERRVRSLFSAARASTPAVVFFDELDALVARREFGGGGGGGAAESGILATLLTEMDGVAGWEGVLLVGATNRRDALDPALLRAGRLELHLEVPLPDARDRAAIFAVHMRKIPRLSLGALQDQFLQRLGAATEGFSGAQIADLCRRAVMMALREGVQRAAAGAAGGGSDMAVGEDHFELALAGLKAGGAE